MPSLADTTIRLLGQEPLAGRVPAAEQLRLAEILDKAGFAYLEVSGGGCFDAAVKRGVESPWERIRALKARVKTPLGLALRGRFLVGTRPVDADFSRRFVASAAANGIDVFRLHDPLNDVSNLREAAEAIVAAERDFEAGLVYSPGRTGEIETLIERAQMLPELGAVRVLLHDPTGSLQPHTAEELVRALAEASGLPVGIYAQGAGGSALAASLAAARAGAQLIACAIYPLALTLHRVSGEALAEALDGIGLDPGVDVDALWEATDLVDEHIGDELVTPLVPRIAVLAARHDLPAERRRRDRPVAARGGRGRPARRGARGARPDPRRDRLAAARLADRPGARLAGAAQRPLGEPLPHVVDELRGLVAGALRHAAGADRPGARARRPAHRRPRERGGRHAAARRGARAGRRLRGERGGAAPARALRRGRRAAAARDPQPRTPRRRARRRGRGARRANPGDRADRAGVGHRRGHDRGGRDADLGPLDARPPGRRRAGRGAARGAGAGAAAVQRRSAARSSRVESPMVGTFYRAPQPGSPPFVEVGDVVAPGQTLCILEAMKLMNEVKAEVEGVVRGVHAENAEPVEFGQLLFELEPLVGRPAL